MKTKQFITLLVTTLLIFGLFSPALASWYFEIDNADNDNVIEIWFRTDESITTFMYKLAFEFDSSEVSWCLGDFTNTPPEGMYAMFGDPTYNAYDADNVINNLTAATFSEVTIDSDVLIASFTLTVNSSATLDGLDDFYWGIDALSTGAIINGTGYSLDELMTEGHLILGEGLDIGFPVPVPAAVWLLGSGLLGLAGIRFRSL